MRHVMIDLETLSTSRRGVVLCLAAVFFDRAEIGSRILMHLDVDQQIRTGREIDWSTIQWWNQVPDGVRSFIFGALPRIDPATAIYNLREFVRENGDGPETRVWCHGMHFDAAILEDLSRQYFPQRKLEIVPYPAWRDVRSFCEGVPRPPKQTDRAHDPLADCLHQIDWVQDAWAERERQEQRISESDLITVIGSERYHALQASVREAMGWPDSEIPWSEVIRQLVIDSSSGR